MKNAVKNKDECWIQTNSGIHFNPLNPRLEDINIKDIAHALSNICRFCGHSKVFYSVAEHSTIVSEFLPTELKLVGLLHDASEAYITDIPAPLKPFLSNYEEIEERLSLKIYERFGIKETFLENRDRIREMDERVLASEKKILMDIDLDWGYISTLEPLSCISMVPLSPATAEKLFLDFFNFYVGLNEKYGKDK